MKNAAEVFRRYEAVRLRLPAASFPRDTRAIGSLAEITRDIDAFVFDAFGVLNVGETLIPGADHRLMELRRAGCRIRVLTNAASYDKAGAIAKFQRLGLALEDDEIITSRDATLRSIEARHWGVIAAPGDGLTDMPAGPFTRLGDDAAGYATVDGFLFLSSVDWTLDRQALLEEALSRDPRPVVIANADLVAPRENEFSMEPGLYGHRIADRIATDIRFFGKPFGDVYALAAETLPGIAPDRIAMCGDTLHTDILGAAALGWRTVLVTCDGLFAGHDVAPFIAQSGIRPDWMLPRI